MPPQRRLNPGIKSYVFGCLTLLGLMALLPQREPAGRAARGVGEESPYSGLADSLKIPLRPDMVTNEEGRGNAGLLVDEQAAFDPACTGKCPAPRQAWFAGWADGHYPAHAFVDLGTPYHLTDVVVFDGPGDGDIVVSAGVPFGWRLLFTDDSKGYLEWKRHLVNVTARYIRVTLTSATSTPEILLYGTKGQGRAAATAPVTGVAKPLPPTMEGFIGVNSFIDVPAAVDDAAGFIREYHNLRWNEGKEMNQVKLSPGYPGWDFDRYYLDRRERRVAVFPCIQGGIPWLTANNDHKPLPEGKDARDPFSYAAHAGFMFQYAARYGSARVPAEKLRLAPGHPPVSGLNLVGYYENWNEPNKDWSGREAEFLPYEYAAMTSADYDGHQGRMGDRCGVKNADPGAKLVMGGLAGLNLDYVKAMKAWADHHRAGSFPADVLNFHHYCRTGSGGSQVGVSPEQDRLKEKMREVVAYRDQYLPGKEVWLSEFGYDVHPQSPQRAPAIGAFSPAEVQAQWLVRSYLELAAAGIDRAMAYMIRDHDTNAGGKYATSGLVTDKNSGHQPRTSWYYVYTLKNTLAGTRFVQEVPSGRPDVNVYQFRSPDGGRDVYAVWCPTSNQTHLTHYALELPGRGRPVRADLIVLADGDTDGKTTPLRVANRRVTLPVGESPVFVAVTADKGLQPH